MNPLRMPNGSATEEMAARHERPVSIAHYYEGIKKAGKM
jgi:hypothetical protein